MADLQTGLRGSQTLAPEVPEELLLPRHGSVRSLRAGGNATCCASDGRSSSRPPAIPIGDSVADLAWVGAFASGYRVPGGP
jgi:hypothetical protein